MSTPVSSRTRVASVYVQVITEIHSGLSRMEGRKPEWFKERWLDCEATVQERLGHAACQWGI